MSLHESRVSCWLRLVRRPSFANDGCSAVGGTIEVAGKRESCGTDDSVLIELEQSSMALVEELSTESTLDEP